MSLTATDRPREGVISHHQTQLASTCALFPMFNASGTRGTRAAQSVPKEVPSTHRLKIVPIVLHFQAPFAGTCLLAKSLCSIAR